MDSSSNSPFKKVLRFIATRPTSQLSILGILLGIAFGFLAQNFSPSDDVTRVMSFIGTLFINCLKAIVILFVIIIMVRTPMDMKEIGKAKNFAVLTICYYIITSFIASLLGLACVNIAKPGGRDIGCVTKSASEANLNLEAADRSLLDSFLDVFLQAVPPNLFMAIVNDNLLGILVGFIVIGFIAAGYSGTRNGKNFKGIIDLLYQVIVDLLGLAIMITPMGVFSLISGQIARVSDNCVFAQLAIYIVTFVAANLIFVLVFLPLMFGLIVWENPFPYFKHFFSAAVTAFSTASSAASLPLVLQGAYELGIDKRTANFIIPLGATLNMNGSSIYYPVTIVFISMMMKRPISIPTQILVCLVSTLVTVGGAPVPSGAIVYLLLVGQSTGVPLEINYVTLVWLVDPIMDRILTATNVIGDCYGVRIIETLFRKMTKAGDKNLWGSESDGGDDGIGIKVPEKDPEKLPEISNSSLSNMRKSVELSLKKINKRKESQSRPGTVDASKKNDDNSPGNV